MDRATAVWEVEGPAVGLGLVSQASMAGPLPQLPSQRSEPCRLVQQITVPICACPPLGVAMHIARETYETAALPLSHVGADQEWPMLLDISYSALCHRLETVLETLAQRSNS